MARVKKREEISLPRCLYVYWKILGLCPFVFVENEIIRNNRGGLLYATILTLLYTLSYARVIEPRFKVTQTYESTMTITAGFIGLSTEFLMVVLAWYYFALRQNELKRIIDAFKNIHASAKLVGINQNFRKILRTLILHVITINLTWCGLTCCDHVVLFNRKSLQSNIIWIPFNIPRIVNRNVVIIFINALLIVTDNFYLLNKKIHNLPNEDTGSLRLPRRLLDPDNQRNGLRTYATPGLLEIYSQMHSDLVALTRMIANFFALPIILSLLTHACLTAADIYILWRMTKDKKIPRESPQALYYVIMCCWLSFHVVKIVYIITSAESAANEANQSGRVLHRMLMFENSQNYVETGQIVSLRLLHRHLTVSLWGLIRMRLSVVHTIFGTVCTYVTVMMQLDGQNFQRKMLAEIVVHPTNTSELNQ